MSTKKPAQLGDNLLSIRPRKGAAKPQSEQQASQAEVSSPVQNEKPAQRRRRRLSDKKMQLNLKVDEKTLERFIKLADDEGIIFGDLLKKMIAKYEQK